MNKNKVRIWQLLGLAAVVIAAKAYSDKKPKALPGAVIDAKEYVANRKAEKEHQEESL